MNLEAHFKKFREQTVGTNASFTSIYGPKNLMYADWIASGRLYGPIEDTMRNNIGPMVANTHSFSSETGKASTYAYRHARNIIKKHVNAGNDDILVTSGTGMTGVLARLQRIMGLRWPDGIKDRIQLKEEEERPVVFISHMEHHSNQVSWMETIADVVIVSSDNNGLISLENLEAKLEKYANRSMKIGAFTACSNVTGIITPYQEIARIMHRNGGICIVDFAASAPYVTMDMHPADTEAYLDGILFSPHKFLGGPGSCGVLVFHKSLYKTTSPDVPGGGNVLWTNPDGEFKYHEDIEVKEDGGTPGFLQVMRCALAINLKDEMNVDSIARRERTLLKRCFEMLSKIPGLEILGDKEVPRIGCVSFHIKNIHYNLVVRLLNDRFGIQTRGGWSCASTYAHSLFDISAESSMEITQGIDNKCLEQKPGWVRLSLHPTMTDKELECICDAIAQVVLNIDDWGEDYKYNLATNEFDHIIHNDEILIKEVENWFAVPSAVAL